MNTTMSDSEENYYDDLAEVWGVYGASGAGGGKKKKVKPTTVGRRRVGGTSAWGFSNTICEKNCTKKCCNKNSKSSGPTL